MYSTASPGDRHPDVPGEGIRSRESIAFEQSWNSLRVGGQMPSRKDLTPAKFIPFLPNLLLIEATGCLRIRLVGTALQFGMQRDVVGHSVTELYSPELHTGLRESAQAMITHPCGLWQQSQIHYRRGFAEYFELTAFPLAAAGGRDAGILCHSSSPQRPVMPAPVPEFGIRVDTAECWRYLDIGYGLPGPRS